MHEIMHTFSLSQVSSVSLEFSLGGDPLRLLCFPQKYKTRDFQEMEIFQNAIFPSVSNYALRF